MAITTFAGIRNNKLPLQQPLLRTTSASLSTTPAYSSWYGNGYPVAGGLSTSLAGATCSSATSGAMPFVDAAAGKQNYLTRLRYSNPSETIFAILADRLWHNGGFNQNTNSLQTVNSVTWPARDINASTNGEGVLIALEISTTTGSGTPTITYVYTNSAGVTGRTSTSFCPTQASQAQGCFIPLGLQAGDTGVRSVQSLTLSASWSSTGVMNLVAYKPIAAIECQSVTWPNVADVMNVFSPILDQSCLFAINITARQAASTQTFQLDYELSQG